MIDQTSRTEKNITGQQRKDALPPPPLSVLATELGVNDLTIEWLAGDGSDRCYYRLSSRQLVRDYVLMQLSETDAKKLQENGYEWIEIGTLLSDNSILVPKTVAKLPEYAAIVIEDYGNTMLETAILRDLDRRNLVDAYYQQAIGIIGDFLTIPYQPDQAWTSRAFDEERFVWEMNFFYKHFLQQVSNIELDRAELQLFHKDCQSLAAYLAGYSNYFVHRDYHSRNLMIQNERIAVIDFQDARLGPPSYDLVSICFDSYIPLSQSQRIGYLDLLKNRIESSHQEIWSEVVATWRPMLLQRQLKALGSFGYLSNTKKRGNYLQYLQPAMSTLEAEVVGDDRWPFLSYDIISRINKNLG